MKTPEQIRDMEFQKATMGGYKQSDVELFLEEVASQIEIILRQKQEAERKLQEFIKKVPEAAISTAGIQNVLVNAQRVAEQIAEDAKAEAERVVADANLKLAEADVKAREIVADAENKAVLLGQTAEVEAAKIIGEAVKRAENIVAEAKESVELEQKLYDRLKIEVSDFRKKAAAQCSALTELINQLPGEIPFNLERSKTVFSVDFSNPEELLRAAVNERLAKEAGVEAEVAEEPEIKVVPQEVEEPVMVTIEPETVESVENNEIVEEFVEDVAEEVAAETADVEFAEEVQLQFDNDSAFDVENSEQEDTEEVIEEEVAIPITEVIKDDEPIKPRGHISFSDDDDDDEDDEPRLFFRRKRK